MYCDNTNIDQDNDLKFIPLNINENFTSRNSNWLPDINTNLPKLGSFANDFPNNFSFPNGISNLNMNSLNSLDSLDYIQDNQGNLKDGLNIQNGFNLQDGLNIPQGFNNKNYIASNNGIKMENTLNPLNAQDGVIQENVEKQGENRPKAPVEDNNAEEFENNFDLDYPSEELNEELVSYNKDKKCKSKKDTTNMNKTNLNNTSNLNNTNQTTSRAYISEPIHMQLLKNISFEGCLEEEYRGEFCSISDRIDDVYETIDKDQAIIDIFKAYNVPKPIYQLVIKKIIKISLENCHNKWGE